MKAFDSSPGIVVKQEKGLISTEAFNSSLPYSESLKRSRQTSVSDSQTTKRTLVHRLSLSSSERFIPINRTSQEEEDSDPFLRSLTQRRDVFSEREEEEKDENDSQLDNKQGTQSDNDQDQLEEDEHTGPSFHTRHIEKRNRGIWRKKR